MPIKEKKKITQSKPTHKSNLLKNKPSKKKKIVKPKISKKKTTRNNSEHEQPKYNQKKSIQRTKTFTKNS